MIFYKTDDEVALMKISAELVSNTLAEIAKILKPGITTLALDQLANTYIRDHDAIPSFYNYNGFPSNIITSLNDVVVHGLPGKYELKDGDILSVDIGTIKNGFHGDHAYTFIIGETTKEVLDLVKITKESLYLGIENAVVGKRMGDIGWAIQHHNEKNGYGVVRDLVGHGLGKDMHEDPQVPNYGKKGAGPLLRENLVLAIEPMINMGKKDVYLDEDGWAIRTADGSPSVHFEHDVCVKKGQALILSNYQPIELAEQANRNLNTSYYA
ncbi:type I methionyl aminopeptidase [Pedobacter sandarakinus]|uniref:type I methionyl aminopeptidase n=1 Tax=Pedobacter sandarakinus TaxID=353156 RepID=UPI00224789BC|nr:type I methionyl aminopeptidase [Pedobacter sandarakinus]MCX2574584.1 type I methionyl aminopeptidase [Pedobacter sandarakinus]